MMGMVPIDSLETGMTLAGDVFDRTGRMLLGSGTELTGKHLTIFRTWGVVEVNIEGVNDSETAVQLPPDITMEELLAAEKELEPRFRHAGLDNPVIQELLRIAAAKKAHNAHI